jgi:N-acetylglutamate synthase-like GNAT family acetyltransferase
MNSNGHYELVQASSPEDWEALHNLRRSELFTRMEGVTYNADHPDDRAPNHFPLILKFQDQHIGTARLDLFENGGAAIRLVAIAQQEQRKGYGRVLEQLFEEFARSKGVSKIFVNAHSSAVGYYERLGFVHEDWQEPSGTRSGVAKNCVFMTKQL